MQPGLEVYSHVLQPDKLGGWNTVKKIYHHISLHLCNEQGLLQMVKCIETIGKCTWNQTIIYFNYIYAQIKWNKFILLNLKKIQKFLCKYQFKGLKVIQSPTFQPFWRLLTVFKLNSFAQIYYTYFTILYKEVEQSMFKIKLLLVTYSLLKLNKIANHTGIQQHK